MTSGVAAAELDALVQDAIVWASQHGLVGGGAAMSMQCKHSEADTLQHLHLSMAYVLWKGFCRGRLVIVCTAT
jgi:hypothetical protein